MTRRRSRKLVTGFIEYVSSKVFSDYPNELTVRVVLNRPGYSGGSVI